jgi:uroporphyrinogen-III synthase
MTPAAPVAVSSAVPAADAPSPGADPGGHRAARSGPGVPAAEATTDTTGRPLEGFRVGITSARKVEELTSLLERRGAVVEAAPALAIESAVEDEVLRTATEAVIDDAPDLFLATTGIGLRRWFAAAESWGLLPDLVRVLQSAQIIARGPKSVGALRARGLRELWSPPSECFDDVLTYLRGSSLDGRRIVVQEHGQSLSVAANALRHQGADVRVVTVYRCEPTDDQAAMFRMVDLVAERAVDAVTFTSAPAVEILLDVAAASGRHAEVIEAFRDGVLATCVGPVTAKPFDLHGVPVVQPSRSRLAAMVKALEIELPRRRRGTELLVAGRRLLLHDDGVCVDGHAVSLSPAPRAVLGALAERPGLVLSRRDLMRHLPSGHAGSEHAVEVAVARLRSAIGTGLVQTVVKRGYRLPVT